MAKILSPGQKRRRVVTLISLAVFIVVTLIAAHFYGRIMSTVYEWTHHRAQVSATVTELEHEVEEYRNSKGRQRTRDLYYVYYQFSLDSIEYDNYAEISFDDYANLTIGENLTVAYNPEYPDMNDTEANIQSIERSSSLIDYVIAVGPYTGIGCLFLYRILAMLFVRESKTALPKGFYTQRSWLDVDDKAVVFAQDNDIVFFDVKKSRIDSVQEAYQDGASLDELIKISKVSEVNRVAMQDILTMRSDHDSDTIKLETEDSHHSVEFLNIALKNHALKRFQLMISDDLDYSLKARTRLQAALQPSAWLALFFGLFLFFDMIFLKLVFGYICLFMNLPALVKQLINPRQTEIWQRPSSATESETALSN